MERSLPAREAAHAQRRWRAQVGAFVGSTSAEKGSVPTGFHRSAHKFGDGSARNHAVSSNHLYDTAIAGSHSGTDE